MATKRCVFKRDGRTIASESASAKSEAVAHNAALAKANSKVEWDDETELTLYCEDV